MFCSITLTGEFAFDWIGLAADKSAAKAEDLPENVEVGPQPPVDSEVVSCGRLHLSIFAPPPFRRVG